MSCTSESVKQVSYLPVYVGQESGPGHDLPGSSTSVSDEPQPEGVVWD